MLAWAVLVGCVGFEVLGQYGPGHVRRARRARRALRAPPHVIADTLGLPARRPQVWDVGRSSRSPLAGPAAAQSVTVTLCDIGDTFELSLEAQTITVTVLKQPEVSR